MSFLTINQVLQRALAQESRGKENKEVHRYKIDRPKVNMVEYDSDHSDNEANAYTAEFVWPSKDKPFTCQDLKSIHKNRDDDMKFTFNIAKCDRIFDALLQAKFIRKYHALSLFKELKRHAYCKYHNSFSDATNDCNVFRRHIQSAINDGTLNFSEMQIDKQPFPMNTMNLERKKMLIRPGIAESTNKYNVVIGESRKSKDGSKVSERQVVLARKPGGGEIIMITIKNPTPEGQPQVRENTRVRFVKPRSPEVGKWKTNEAKAHHKKIKPTFDMLLSKYSNRASCSSSNRSSRLKRSRSPPK